jgi:hypothetical protein
MKKEENGQMQQQRIIKQQVTLKAFTCLIIFSPHFKRNVVQFQQATTDTQDVEVIKLENK